MTGPLVALLGACCVHAGFQAVVTVVLYPTLAEVSDDRWRAVHDAHCRRITRVVAPLYGGLVAVWTWVALAGDSTAGVVVAAVGTGLAGVVTAAVAAPLHTRLSREGPRPDLLRALLRADRVRCAGAVLAAVAAVLALR